MSAKASLLEQLRIDRGDEGLSDGVHRGGAERKAAYPWKIAAIICGVIATAIAGVAGQRIGRLQAAPASAAAEATSHPKASADSSVATTTNPSSSSEPVRAREGGSVLDASGYIVAQREATVSSKTVGRLRDLLIEEGQHVKAGQVLAWLDDSNALAALGQVKAQLTQAEAGLEAARIALADASPIFARNQRQHAAAVISAQDFDTAKSAYDAVQTNYATQQAVVATARANLLAAERSENDMVVKAPFSGIVTDKAAQPGEIVSPMASGGYTRTGICTIVDMDSLEAEVDVSENFINLVYSGQPVVVRLNAYPDWDIPANVVAIIPTADRSKATVKVRIGFKARDPRILPQMGLRVAFLGGNERATHTGTGKG